jgi:hypothetical protein
MFPIPQWVNKKKEVDSTLLKNGFASDHKGYQLKDLRTTSV